MTDEGIATKTRVLERWSYHDKDTLDLARLFSLREADVYDLITDHVCAKARKAKTG